MKLIVEYIKKFKWGFIASFLLVGVAVFAQLLQPQILSKILTAIVTQDTSTITQLGLVLVGIAFVGFIAGVANTFVAAKVSQMTGSDLRKRVFDKVQTFSYTDVEKFEASNLVVRLVNDSQQVQSLIMILQQSLTRMPIMFVGAFIMAMIAMPQLWWVVLLAMLFVIVSVGLAFSKMGPMFGKMQRFIERINAIAKENFLGMRVVKSFVQEESEINKFSQESDKLTKEILGVGYTFSILMPMFFLIMDLSISLVVFIVGRKANLDPAVIGQAVSFISYLTTIMMALMMGGMMVSFSSRAFVSVGRIKEVLDTDATMSFGNSDQHIKDGSISFKNVSYQYGDLEKPTLENISFEVEHGKTLGIVGASGSGKSTLAQMIARIYDPSSGVIEVGHTDLKDLSQKTLQEDISLVLQRPIIFSGTIADTLRQGKRDASLDEMITASKIAQAYEFIQAEEGQFDAVVYQRGTNYSGGQKQRLSIARGLINNPKILILDDSTSALDAQSEKRVQDALRSEMSDTTKVIVSQKISSIVKADLILVLEKGQLVNQGTHSELLEASDIYREIYETQKGKSVLDAFEGDKEER